MTLSSSYQCPKWWYHYHTKSNLKQIRLVPSSFVNNFLHSECNNVQCTPAVVTTSVLIYTLNYPPTMLKSLALPWYEGNTHKRSGLFLCVHLHATCLHAWHFLQVDHNQKTSTFAGQCRKAGLVYSGRLNDARFNAPWTIKSCGGNFYMTDHPMEILIKLGTVNSKSSATCTDFNCLLGSLRFDSLVKNCLEKTFSNIVHLK